ncbi:tail fiber domain-containing protein [Bdellovibrio reynosensis]|uniref:Tail fiber domain-containing protein n=1 Tax=Bdellovibrio reynosensis TaxID=2835041 RepID=A0ABY4CCF3_9BACT|nr:tail fiber domain-containing protein [Bdellovibrio reynosensis]UOF02580.1 tail fiber domain-containing protein [Bdellovibrio reynosensis]
MKKRNVFAALLLLFSLTAYAVPGSLTYQGRIKDSQGQGLEVNGVVFEFTIMNPTGTCALYRETSNAVDMRNSTGVFDVPIGTGTKNFPAAAGFKLLDSFDNSAALSCEGGGTYTPLVDDKRVLRVQFHDGTGWKLISPDSEIRSVPFAGHAKVAQTALKLGSNVASDFVAKSSLPVCAAGEYLRHIAPSGTFVCSAPSVPGANVTGNIAGSAAGFTGSLVGDVSGTQGATSVDKIKGVTVDMTGIASGKVLKYDGSKWAPADDAGTAGSLTGLTGDVTSSGSPVATVTLADGTVATAKIVDGAVNSAKILDATIVDADIAAGAAIVDTKLATISTAGKVSGSAITSGTIAGTTAINTSGLIQTSNGFRVYQGANYVELKAPAALAGDLTFKLPDTLGSSGQVLTNNGSGNLTWSTPAVGSVTSVSASAPLASSGGATPTISLSDTVTAGTATKITYNAKGLVTGGASLVAGDIPNLTGDVTSTGGAASTKVVKIQNVGVVSTTPLTGQAFLFDGTNWGIQYFGFGQMRSTTTGNLQMPTSCSTADKTLTWSAITDTFACTTIAIANTQVSGLGTASTKNFGTSAGQLVELDGGARIPASLLPVAAGGVLVDGGNTTGAAISVGANDDHSLLLKTNNATRITVANSGNVGVGYGSPAVQLDVASKARVVDAATAYLMINGDSGNTQGDAGEVTGVLGFGSDGANTAGVPANGMTLEHLNFAGTHALAFRHYNASTMVERMRINNDGKVGIGTTAPIGTLDIVANNSSYLRIQQSSADTNAPAVAFAKSRGDITTPAAVLSGDRIMGLYGQAYHSGNAFTANIAAIQFLAAENITASAQGSSIDFGTTPIGSTTRSTRMTLGPNGYLGIGQSSPVVPLHVRSALATTATHPYRAGIIAEGEGTDVTGRIGLKTSSATESPVLLGYRSRGTIASPTTLSSGDVVLSIVGSGYDGTAWSAGANSGEMHFVTTEAHSATNHGTAILFKTIANGTNTNAETMRIDHDGEVGIGTSSPSAALDVARDQDSNTAVRVRNSHNSGTTAYASTAAESDGSAIEMVAYSTTHTGTFGTVPIADSVALRSWAGKPTSNMFVGTGSSAPLHLGIANTPRLTFATNGYTGLGTTTPNGQLDLQATGAHEIRFGSTGMSSTNKDFRIVQDNAANFTRLSTGGDTYTWMSFQMDTGFVGIGNTSPQYTLDVTGNFRITGTPYRNGGDIAWTVPSDKRLKDVTGQYQYGLKEIANLDVIRFRYKNGNAIGAETEKEFVGVLAQEVQKQIPDAVKLEKNGYLSLNSSPIFWALVNSTKELKFRCESTEQKVETHSRMIASLVEENKELKAKVKNTESEMQKLKAANDDLKARMDKIERMLLKK